MTETPEDRSKSLEEEILEKIDAAATTAQLPVQKAVETTIRLKHLVIAVVIYGLILGIASTYAIWRVEKNSDQNTEYLIQSCDTNNESRALEKGLWDTILLEDLKLAEAEGYKISKAERAALDRIIDTINRTYPQRDCDRVAAGDVVEVPAPSPTPTLPSKKEKNDARSTQP